MSRPVGPICCQCEVEMRIDTNGVLAVTQFLDPPQPYEVWDSDRYKCPKCGMKVLTGYGDHALAEHYDTERMTRVLHTPGMMRETLNVYVYKGGWL